MKKHIMNLTSSLFGLLILVACETNQLSNSAPSKSRSTFSIVQSTNISTATFVHSATFTQIPTFSNKLKQENLLLSALLTNQGCKLPCWWGIVPGQTSWRVTTEILKNLGIDLTLYAPTGIYEGHYFFSDADFGISLSLDLAKKNEIVDSLTFHSEGYYKSDKFKKMFVNLAPEKIIPENGVPSAIEIEGGISADAPLTNIFYTMKLVYAEKGMNIIYAGTSPYTAGISVSRICPTFAANGNASATFSIVISSSPIKINAESPDSIEKIDGMMPLDVYNLYNQSNKPICFDAPTELFLK